MESAVKILSCLLMLSISSISYGFGPNGHRVIGEIANTHLSDQTRRMLSEIMDGEPLAFAATWPDDQRSAPDQNFWGYNGTANWHFINVPPHESYAESGKNPKGDAYVALKTFVAILEAERIPEGPVKSALQEYFGNLDDPTNSKKVKQFAVRFIVHIVGDIHQPLHCGYASDNGGNSIMVNWFGQLRNLHGVWDTDLVEAQQLTFSELVRKIDRADREEINRIQDSQPIDWINESLELRTKAYDVAKYRSKFSYGYTYHFVPVIEKQMLHGGLRAAAVFNAIFDK